MCIRWRVSGIYRRHGKHEYLRHRNAAGVETKTGDVGGGKYGKGGHFKAWEKNN